MENRIIKNIFKNAKFGDKFMTRDGRPAVLIFLTDYLAILAVKRHSEFASTNVEYLLNGKTDYLSEGLDIVSKWGEPIDTKES